MGPDGPRRGLEHFLQAIAERVLAGHRRLLETFGHTPTTLEMEARERFGIA